MTCPTGGFTLVDRRGRKYLTDEDARFDRIQNEVFAEQLRSGDRGELYRIL